MASVIARKDLSDYFDIANVCDKCTNDESCCKNCMVTYANDYAGMQMHYLLTGELLTHAQYTYMAENGYLEI